MISLLNRPKCVKCMIKIVNIKTNSNYNIYCGRTNKTYNLSQSKWANPFVIGKDGDRNQVIEKYRLWINSNPDLLESLHELKDQTLGCWCVPEKCHCETLKELAESKYMKNWFSNMLPFESPLIYQEIEYKTPENFYQAAKLPKESLDLRAKIASMFPFEAKRALKDKTNYQWRSDWTNELKLKVMKFALDWKFQKGTDWHRKLMITKNLNLELVEWNTWDTYWGKHLGSKKGENHLGKILMEIRDN